MTDIMNHQEPTDQRNNRIRLFYLCLVLSLIFHTLVVLGIYFFKSDEVITFAEQPTIVKLVDFPQKAQERPLTQEDKSRDYEVDPVPATDNTPPKIESQRKADRNQQVEQEQAPEGEDTRDETTQLPVLIEPSAPPKQPLQSQPTKQPQAEPTAGQEPREQQTDTKIKETITPDWLDSATLQTKPDSEPIPEPAPEPATKTVSEPVPAPETAPEAPQQPILSPDQLFPDARTLSRIAQGKMGDQNRTKLRDELEIGDTVWLNLQNDLLVSFFRRFRDRIERVWNYPKAAAQQGMEGTLELLIIVNREGELIDVLPTKGSGSDILDLAAIQAVYAGAPFGPLSEHYPHQQLKIRAYFSYRISGHYIYGR